MQRQKAAEIIGYSRRRARAIGFMIWPIMLVIGFAGWYLWKWYALPISLVGAALFGSFYSMFETKRLQRITGLTIHEQAVAFRECAAASLEPTTRTPEQYRSYIDSLPDDVSNEKQ